MFTQNNENVPMTPSQFPCTPGQFPLDVLFIHQDSQMDVTEEQNVFSQDDKQPKNEFISFSAGSNPLHLDDPLYPILVRPFGNDEAGINAHAEDLLSRIGKRDKQEKQMKQGEKVNSYQKKRNEGLSELVIRKRNGGHSLLVNNEMKIRFLGGGESICEDPYYIGDTLYGKSMPEFRIHNESEKLIRIKMRLCIKHTDEDVWRGNVFPYAWRESGGHKGGVTNQIPSGETYVLYPSRAASRKDNPEWTENARRWMKEHKKTGKISRAQMYQLSFSVLEDEDPPVIHHTIYTDLFAFNTGFAPQVRDEPVIVPAPRPQGTTGQKRLPPPAVASPIKVAKLEGEIKELKMKISGLEQTEKNLKDDNDGLKNVLRLRNMAISDSKAELRVKDMIIHDLEFKLKETDRDADYLEMVIDQEAKIEDPKEKISKQEKTAAAPTKKPELVVSKYLGFANFMMKTLQDIKNEEDANEIKARLGSFILDPKTARFLNDVGQTKLDPAVAKLIPPSDVAQNE